MSLQEFDSRLQLTALEGIMELVPRLRPDAATSVKRFRSLAWTAVIDGYDSRADLPQACAKDIYEPSVVCGWRQVRLEFE